jgi:RNA polymerase sigma-70 factor (ECF subfamily)
MDEQKIIKGLKNMEDWAVEAVVELYGDRLTKSAYMVCSDRYLAEEAVQDAFLTLCRKIDSFREDSSLYSWLYRITINHARNKTRNRWFRKVLPREEEQFEEAPDYRTPEQRVVEIEASDEIRRSLSMLSLPYRQVIDLYYIQDLKVREIAMLLGVSKGTVKSRLSRARERLGKILGERWAEHDG